MFPHNFPQIGQILAQIPAFRRMSFVLSGATDNVDGQAFPSSTGMCLRVQNRYPSPLRRSAHPGRPPFFSPGSSTRNGRQAAVMSHLSVRPIDQSGRNKHILPQGARRGATTIGSGHRFCDLEHRGARSCVEHSYSRAFWSSHSASQPAILTQSVRLWAQAQALPFLSRLAATHLSVASLAEQLARFATTWASASKVSLTRKGRTHSTNRASGSKPGGRFFSFAPPQEGPEGGQICSRKS